MANTRVALVGVVKTERGWKRYPAVVGRNGKVRPGIFMVKEKPQEFDFFRYEIRFYQGSRMMYESVGSDPTEALNKRNRKVKLLLAHQAAESAGAKMIEPERRVRLAKKGDDWIQRQVNRDKKASAVAAKSIIAPFLESTGVEFADEVDEKTILAFHADLRKKGNADRTIYNKHIGLMAWLKWCGVDAAKFKDITPGYTEKKVDVYTREESQALFAACKPYQRLAFQLLLYSGLRMQEAIHLEWSDIDFANRQISVIEKKEELGFDVKDRDEREVPIPDALVESLKSWRETHPSTTLVIGTRNDTPNWKLLDSLKRVVRRAGLNCGKCSGCKRKKNDFCERWFLHKMRASYTTRMLQSGLDARTVMEKTGHTDFRSFMRYLKAKGNTAIQPEVNSIV